MGKQNSSFINNIKYVNVNSAGLDNLGKTNSGIVGDYVVSVNGKSGDVQLDALDVNAMPLLEAIIGDLVVPFEIIEGREKLQYQRFITSVDFPNATYADLNGTFRYCYGLKEIKGLDKVTNGYFDEAFRGCESLEMIDDGVFQSLETPTHTHTFYNMLYGCKNLKNIPNNLFGAIKELRTYRFYGTFWLSGLEEIPSGLFRGIIDNDPRGTGADNDYAFSRTFSNTQCVEIPEGLMDNFVYAGYYEFQYAFSHNSKLVRIPKYLFKNIEGWIPTDTGYGKYAFSYCFAECSNLESDIEFSSLERVGQYMFQYAFSLTKMKSVSFPALRSDSFAHDNGTAFNSMLNGVNGCTVHFPSNIQSVIGNWGSVLNGFGGTNTTVLFDLPATE